MTKLSEWISNITGTQQFIDICHHILPWSTTNLGFSVASNPLQPIVYIGGALSLCNHSVILLLLASHDISSRPTQSTALPGGLL